MTSAAKRSMSMGSLYLRACAWSADVKKPWGKKKAEIQKDAGGPPVSQLRMNWKRAIMSLLHEPSGLSEGYPLPPSPHGLGTCWKRKFAYAASSCALITTRPLSARCISLSMVETAPSSRLNFSTSWVRKMPSGFIEPSSSLSKVASAALLISSFEGSRASRSSHTSPTTSSGVLPEAPPPVRGCTEMMVSSMLPVSFCWKEMSAFWCRPKISGRSTIGKVAMNVRYDSTSPSAGGVYLNRSSSCGQYE
mmetsp:Transcript_2383/g.7988  ORF Transcript_2383/g.7988 Transcript_2383/m.7988 type:complete len:249 (-) Transcript_2383:1750-2496(-)